MAQMPWRATQSIGLDIFSPMVFPPMVLSSRSGIDIIKGREGGGGRGLGAGASPRRCSVADFGSNGPLWDYPRRWLISAQMGLCGITSSLD
eukprot:scaffold18816_cov32-Tisochrysis_lutea.AAC.6